jgi:hypothetical protein
MVSRADDALRSTAADAVARVEYLDAVSGLLWPGSSRMHGRGAQPRSENEMLIAPSFKVPRLTVPAGNRRAAATAMRAFGHWPTRRARRQRVMLAAFARLGLTPWAMAGRLRLDPDEPSIDSYLAEIFGQPLITSLALTPRRANRKPVLHLLDARGRSVGWVKIGVDDLTRRLVRHEGAALQALGGTIAPNLHAPVVLHRGTWHGLDVLVLSPLPLTRTTMPSSAALRRAMRAVATSTLNDDAAHPDTYANVLADRAGEIALRTSAADHDAVDLLRGILDTARSARSAWDLPRGSCHGDWTPWNCGESDGQVYLWDWERCAASVPLGFDSLHYRMHHAMIRCRVQPASAARDCLREAPEVLGPWGLRSRDAELVAVLYLVDIALRYLADDQRAAGGFGGRVEAWIIPALLDWQDRG